MGRKKDRFWEYAEELKDGFRCKFCQDKFCGSISRIKPHLAKVTGKDIKICTKVPDDVRMKALEEIGGPNKKAKGAPSTSDFEKNKITSASSSSPSTALHHLTTLELCNNKDKTAVDKLLAQHVVLNNIPIDVVQTASFSRFVRGVAEYGPNYSLPSDSTLKTKLIPDLRMEVEDYTRKVRESWVTTGCTLMLDLWGDKKQGDFISIIVYSPKGAVFMKPIEIPNERKEVLNLANTVSSVIEEIGTDNVVQFITNARKFESVGDELVLKYPRMYKTRCAAHGIHLLMKDIYKEVGWVKNVIDDTTLIVEHMHKNTIISFLIREHTSNKELKRPCMTRFASNFLMLQSIFEVENELQSLFASSKWRELDCNKEDMAKRVTRIVESTEFWSQGKEVLQVLKPLVRVLQLAESDGSTSGYLYEAMERAKGTIKQLCSNNQAKYMRIWELFDERHFENIIHPIHAAAAFLNPAYMCSENFREDQKMEDGIELIHDYLVAIEEKEDFIEQVQLYRMKVSTLFKGPAKSMLKKSHPWIWWDYCGRSVPVLRKYAVRILSQPCSSSSCERNWSAFEAVQTKKNNKLVAETLDNLVYVRMNAMMMEKSYMMEAQGLKPIDLDQLSDLPEYADHEQSWEDDALDPIDENEVPEYVDQPSELPEKADHEQDRQDDALDAIDENLDEDIMNELPEYVDQPSELPEMADHEQDREDDALHAIDEDLDEDMMNELPEYADHEKNCDDDAFDATDKDLHVDIINDADPASLEENSTYQMENVGESAIPVSAILRQLFDKLSSPGLQQFAQQNKVDTELKKWETFLGEIYAVLDDAEEKHINVQTWLSELTDLAYDVEDILDEIGTEALRHKLMVEPHASTSNVQTLIPASSLRSEIDEITSRLREIVTQINILNLRKKPGSGTNKLRGGPPTASLVVESHLFGRGKDKENILELLLRHEASDDVVCVIPIIGIAGLGKTTLAQFVYNDDKVNGYFDLKAWVYVSKEFNVLSIIGKILQAVTLEIDEDMDWDNLDELQRTLRHKLRGRKFLLVLDDVWNESCDQWYVLRTSFMKAALGSKIIVTTRDEIVASTMGSFSSYHLKELSFDDSLSLVAHHALGTEFLDGHSKQKEICEEIVRRCEGLPLELKNIGSLLRSKGNCDDWEDILNSTIWSYFEEVRSSLKEENRILPTISYHDLPSHLKRCFAYCAIFPKGYEFDKDELVLLWLAEGFLREPEGKKLMEDLGHEYFLELLSRSFFQQSSGNKSRFVMHDLINDLAKSVAGEICFNLEGDTLNKSPEKIRHLAFNHHPYEASQRFEVIYQMEGLRTFLALPLLVSSYGGAHLSNKVLHDLLPKLRYLRALSLSGYNIRKLPDSIGDLKHLRYLNLSYSTIEELPESLSALLNLQTLILHGCRELTKLPAGIGNLIELYHLDISETVHLVKMPSGIGNLTNLQTLPRFTVGKRNGELRVKDLKNLSHIRGQLSIVKLYNVVNSQDAKVANLEEKQGLDDLVLDWGEYELGWESSDDDVVSEQSDDDDDSPNERDDEMQVLDWLQPHRNLKKLTITYYGGTKFPSWIGDPLFSNLVQLNLCYCSMSTSLPSLGQLPLLKDSRIEGMCAVKTVGPEFYGVVGSTSVNAFPSLESLHFKDMQGWEEWVSCTTDEVNDVFPCLRKLVIQDCPKLNEQLLSLYVALDYPNLFVKLPSLHELNIERCSVAILMSLVDLNSLTTLKIGHISGLKSLDILPQLVALEVVEIEHCSELMLLWEANLENLTCLKKLLVECCPQLVFLAGEEGGLLPCNLEELKLLGCEKLEKLPNGLHSLTCLRSLSIIRCPNLVSFPATGLPYTLKRLELFDCKALESLPDGMTIHACNSNQCCFLEELDIDSCPSLKSFSPRGMLPILGLKKLKISNCKNLESLPEGMILDDNNSNNTSHLKSLEISTYTQLKPLLARMLHNNTSLEVIRISYCLNLRSLPLDCLHGHTHLSELTISFCNALESFPERGFSIPNLKSLKIECCENLKSLPNQIHNFTSLQKLRVDRCEGIVSFPEAGLPPNLTSLEIYDCENLKQSVSEWGLYRLSSLRQLRLEGSCPTDSEVSFPDDDCSMLPITLTDIYIEGLENLESISRGIKNLTSLEKLFIQSCPKLHSLPNEGLPASLGRLDIFLCDLLAKRCLKEKGEYWPIISHIPCVQIDLQIQ